MFTVPEEGLLLADTSREFVAIVAEGERGYVPQADQFIATPEDVFEELGVHPNFLHPSAGRPIFVGMAWISRSNKCYPGWPARASNQPEPRGYCVEEPASANEPFTVKFLAGGQGAPLIGAALKLNAKMSDKSAVIGPWYADRYLPEALDVEVFEGLMDRYVVVGHTELRATRKVRFVFVDRNGHEGPSSTPDDPLPASRDSRSDNSNGSGKREANICGSASSACPMMVVPGDLVAQMRSGTIDFSSFDFEAFR